MVSWVTYPHNVFLLLAVISFQCIASAPPGLAHCSPTAYVRAPDLQAGKILDGEAKLVLQGHGCAEVVKWEIGLRLQERAIFRFWRPNATLPDEVALGWLSPQEPGSCEDKYDPETASFATTPGILDYMGFLRNRACLTREQTVYLRALASRDLWDIKAAERVVFDSRTPLPMEADNATLIEEGAFYAVRAFSVHVPETTFPYQRAENDYWADRGDELGAESSYVETMFEYYFLLTTTNGLIVDIPAGKTAFEAPQSHASRKHAVQSQKGGGPPREVRDMDVRPVLMALEPRVSSKPACEAGRVGVTSAKISMPSGVMDPGENATFTIEISQSGNSTGYIDKALLTFRTCQVHTWARSHAATVNQRRETDGCAANPSTWNPDFAAGAGESMLFIDHGDLLHQSRSVDEMCEAGFDRWRANEDGLRELKQDLVVLSKNATHVVYQPLTFDMKIPSHMMPAVNTTFAAYGHLLDLRVEKLYGCEDGGATVSQEQQRELDLRSDAAWSSWYRGQGDDGRSRRIEYGVTPITISTADTTSTRHYTDPEADAIYLTSPSSTEDGIGQPSKVGTRWRTEFADTELGVSNYDVYWRMPGSDGHRRGTGMQLVSEILARQGCAAWSRLRKEHSSGFVESDRAMEQANGQKRFN